MTGGRAPGRKDLARYRRNHQDEVDGAALYRALAALEDNKELVTLYHRLADGEERHAGFWAERLAAAGASVPPSRPSIRARTLRWLAGRMGKNMLLSTLAQQERQGQFMYDDQPETAGTSLPADERSHARLLASITGQVPGGGVEGETLARLEGRHRTIGGNALRAAVLGANDGLVSNLSLVMGVAGATGANRTILLSGLAGLLAGAGSMALGEWLSVQSSRELHQRQLQVEREELEMFPEEEQQELSLIYQAKGVPADQAEALAARIMEDSETALNTMAREELGIDPHELGGSAWEAAITSFVLFAIGAIIPVLPHFFLDGGPALAASLAASAVGLIVLGAGIAVLTGRNLALGALRQAAFGLTAAGLTFGVGKLLGVAISG